MQLITICLFLFGFVAQYNYAYPQFFPSRQNNAFNFPNPSFEINQLNGFAREPRQFFPSFQQQQNFPQQFPSGPSRPFNFPTDNSMSAMQILSTTAAPITTTTIQSVTTSSPQYFSCLQNCQTTMEYNPVCGSDNQNYHNMARLLCASRCGLNVSAVRMGTCAPLGR